MFYNNPFGSWTDGKSNSASVFGALPYPTEANLVQFFFTGYNPNIFNASVYGPNAQLYYRVVTDNQMPGYTVIKDAQGHNLTLIEWQQHPFVEIRGSLSKRSVAQWLPLSPNQDGRAMEVRGMKLLWVPRKDAIHVYSTSTGGSPAFFGRIVRSNGGVVLEITRDAMQLGLLDALVTACFLLQCGRNID